MARVKRGVAAKRRHKKVLEQAKGYYGNKSRSFRAANEQVMHSGQYAFRDRRARKGEFRRLWIQRINAGDPPARPVATAGSSPGSTPPASRSTARSSPTSPSPTPAAFGALVEAAKAALLSRSRASDGDEPLGVHQPADPTTAAPARAPQFAFRGRRVRRRGPGARRRGGRRRLGRRGPVRRPGRRRRSTAPARSTRSADGRRRADRRHRDARRAVRRRAHAGRRRRPCSARRRFVVVADRLADPGNLGTILRSAEAAGVDAVVLTPGTVDVFNPKVVRASAGALFHVPVVAAVAGRRRAPPGCAWSARRRTAATPHTDADWSGRLAIVARQRGPRPRRRRARRRVGAHRAPRPGREPQRGHGRDRAVLRGGPGQGDRRERIALCPRRRRPVSCPAVHGLARRRFRCPG